MSQEDKEDEEKPYQNCVRKCRVQKKDAQAKAQAQTRSESNTIKVPERVY
jgi:hypothetical protein